jgi:hypothetical protein
MVDLTELHMLLDQGKPAQAVEWIRRFQERAAVCQEVQGLEEVATGWKIAEELIEQGDFSRAGSLLEHLEQRSPRPFAALESLRSEVLRRQKECEELLERLYSTVQQSQWREVIAVANRILTLAPGHWEAREARMQAYQQVEPPTLAAPPRTEHPSETTSLEKPPMRRSIIWIDGVGGFLLCTGARVSFGQAIPHDRVEIPIFADISRLHGYFIRDGEGYVLEAVHPVVVNRQTVQRCSLRDGDRLTLGSNCQWRFAQPVTLSSTARLEFVSGHRLRWAVDGVILMSETCVLGAEGTEHVSIPRLRRRAVLFRAREGLGIQIAGSFRVDGQSCRDRALLNANATVTWDEFRFTLEPIERGHGR